MAAAEEAFSAWGHILTQKNPAFLGYSAQLFRAATESGFIERDPALTGFLASLDALIEPLLPSYEREGKSYLTIAVGCTGGKHRSVYVAKKLADALHASGRPVALIHRDLTRDVSGRSEQA